MQERVVFTDFLVRRITQLWAQAASLPERSPAQAHIERLACELSDYMSGLNPRASQSKKRKAPKPMKQELRAEYCSLRIGSFLRDLNDGIHGEIRIKQRTYRVKIADLKSGESRSQVFGRVRSRLVTPYETSLSAKMMVRQAKIPHSTDV